MQLPYIFQGYRCLPGQPLPMGASYALGGMNFALASQHATACNLVLFDAGARQPRVEIPIPDHFRIGDVWCITVLDLRPEDIEYGFRLFDSTGESPVLLDPYAKVITGRNKWGQSWPDLESPYEFRAKALTGIFDWEADRPLRLPQEDLIIYEMHVRGFTVDPSSGVRNGGTYTSMIQRIPYLKALGVNAVELLPIWEFDEFEHWERDPDTDQLYLQYWGYNPIGFFAPKGGYAAGGPDKAPHELKALIKALHENGIEVILDIVLNHTVEGDFVGAFISYKGIDLPVYYILTPDGHFYNFSGTGNSFNGNHPAVIPHLIDCLRYWVTEYHIDGFRFDLASELTRAPDGSPLHDPPLIKLLSNDPVLKHTKLIAEPWDVGGLYQVGSFPHYGRWAEWNGRYRDAVRRFLKGDGGMVGEMIQAVQGYPDMYSARGPLASINYITAHDGFTLYDLVSYNEKHNDQQGGHDANFSYNYGIEGDTDDPQINEIRTRQIKNALTILLTSFGTPMLLMGDEVGRTQKGNNNAYRQDSPISWFDWGLLERNADLFEFTKRLIQFRLMHPALRPRQYPTQGEPRKGALAPISFHGVQPYMVDYGGESRAFAFMLGGQHSDKGQPRDEVIYVAMNMSHVDLAFVLPRIPINKRWRLFLNTGDPVINEPGKEPILSDQTMIGLRSRSVAVIVAH